MGTRNLTMMAKDGKIVMAQYGQWDGYPEGQGLTILHALQKYRPSWLAKQLQCIVPFEEKHMKQYLVEAGADEKDVDGIIAGTVYAPESITETYFANHPEISRDTGGKIISLLADFEGEEFALKNDTEFAGSFSCEWAYLVDFDKNTLEVYTMSSEKLRKIDRFYYLYEEYRKSGDSAYCRPVKLIKSYDLDHLPDDDAFVKELNAIISDDDDEADETAIPF